MVSNIATKRTQTIITHIIHTGQICANSGYTLIRLLSIKVHSSMRSLHRISSFRMFSMMSNSSLYVPCISVPCGSIPCGSVPCGSKSSLDHGTYSSKWTCRTIFLIFDLGFGPGPGSGSKLRPDLGSKRSGEHTAEIHYPMHFVCRLLFVKK